MPFLTPEELKTELYQYQLDEITENDIAITETGIAAAVEESKSYFSLNNMREQLDGRLRYDAEAIFAAEAGDRNPLILAYTKDIAVWHIIQLCNVDVIYDRAKDRYDRAIAYFTKLQKGFVTLSSLPTIADPDVDGNPTAPAPFEMGSRPKFNHE